MAGSPIVKKYLEAVWSTHQKKNSDYSDAGVDEDGDVFSNFRKSADSAGVDVLTSVLVRMTDKWERLCNLHKKAQRGEGPAVADESQVDAALDLIGYAAIYLALYTEEHPEALEMFDGSEEEFMVTSTHE